MSTFVHDCPRCGANKVTMVVHGACPQLPVHDLRKSIWEVQGRCRACGGSAIFCMVAHPQNLEAFAAGFTMGEIDLTLHVDQLGPLVLLGTSRKRPPEHVPARVSAIFEEATTCQAARCWNAAATMFRLVVDLATREFLEGLPDDSASRRVQRELSARVQWLHANGHISAGLEQLAECIREDGNDGAHHATIGEPEVEDMLDFTDQLLR